MAAAEAVWNENSESGDMTLVQGWNYHNELGAQFPIGATRVVYSKAGTLPAACVVRDQSVIDHMLYWAAVTDEREGHYLSAILNSESVRVRVAGLQSKGQWGARHFDKVAFTLPIPRFDASIVLHNEIAAAARQAETTAAEVVIPGNTMFQRARKLIRKALEESLVAARIESLVTDLLDSEL
jgi:hypothetical protein